MTKLPNPNGVQQLRERSQKLKEKRKAPKDLVDLFKKVDSSKKSTKN